VLHVYLYVFMAPMTRRVRHTIFHHGENNLSSAGRLRVFTFYHRKNATNSRRSSAMLNCSWRRTKSILRRSTRRYTHTLTPATLSVSSNDYVDNFLDIYPFRCLNSLNIPHPFMVCVCVCFMKSYYIIFYYSCMRETIQYII